MITCNHLCFQLLRILHSISVGHVLISIVGKKH